MKKILVTTLALSLAVVSGLDAKVRQPRQGRGRAMSAPARVIPADVTQPAKALIDAKADRDPQQIKAAAQDTIAALTDPNMTPDQRELVAQRTKAADLERDMKLKKYEMEDMNLGWFGFGTTKEQKDAYADAKREYNKLSADLKNVNSRIRELEVATGKAWSKAVRLGIGALTAVGISLVAYGIDKYYGGEGMKYLRTKGGELATGAGEYYEGGKKRIGDFYNRMRGNEPVEPLVIEPSSTADMV